MRLRTWERDRLKVESGDAVLDVGCGAGDVVTELAAAVEPDGRAVGIDASEQMLDAARARGQAKRVEVELQVGDATSLPFDQNSSSAVRSERTLQWLPDPAAAVAEMVRVTRPGGRICIIDTDWRTLLVDRIAPRVLRRFLDGMADVRGAQMMVGASLVNLLRDEGIEGIETTAETHICLAWDPDQTPSPPGMAPLHLVAADVVQRGLLEAW